MSYFTDEELQRMRKDTEHSLVERKTTKDMNGWLRTAVAFANSTEIGLAAVLFVGVSDKTCAFEKIVDSGHDWETQQKTVSRELSRAYPPLQFNYRIIRVDGEGECLAVIVPGSTNRPHFAGKSYVRVGPETKEASEEQFDALIAERKSKVYEIWKWIGKHVLLERRTREAYGVRSQTDQATLLDCSPFFVTYVTGDSRNTPFSIPLSRLDLSFDHASNCLRMVNGPE